MTERQFRAAAAARSQQRDKAGIGSARRSAMSAQFRSQTVERNGKQLVRLHGVASSTESPYVMHDDFGPYHEVVGTSAFNYTLAQNPDVAYLLNHRGMTMARTSNGTLTLRATPEGLETEALVNPARSDVHDMLTAIEDGDINEMSFAFEITDGEWSPDMTTYRINQVDLDRGDVSAVNFGANPNTVAARGRELLSDLRVAPAGLREAAMQTLRDSGVSADGLVTDVSADAPGTEVQPDESDAEYAALIQALDAALDEAQNLVCGVDTATLPPNVGQALGLMAAAWAAVSQLMSEKGIDDPDDRDAGPVTDTQDNPYSGAATAVSDQNPQDYADPVYMQGLGHRETAAGALPEQRKAEPTHHTTVVDESWSGPTAVADMPAESGVLSYCHAWVDASGDPDKKGSYKFPHHTHKGGPANLKACESILASLNGAHGNSPDIPSSDVAGVRAHAQAHIDDWNKAHPQKHSQSAPGRSARALRLLLEAE